MANSPTGDSMTERIVRVLETFTSERTVHSASEIGRRAALPSSSAHRIVDDLVSAGLLDRDEDAQVRLGMRLWELALRGSSALRLRTAALPHMETVQSVIREHTQLAVREKDEALFIERLSHPDAGANITRIAGRLPLHASSSGLILLAYAPANLRAGILSRPLRAVSAETVTDPRTLERMIATIRRDGVAIAPGSIQSVSTGVAVPLRHEGEVVAALSVVLPRDTDPAAAVAALRDAATATERDLRRQRL